MTLSDLGNVSSGKGRRSDTVNDRAFYSCQSVAGFSPHKKSERKRPSISYFTRRKPDRTRKEGQPWEPWQKRCVVLVTLIMNLLLNVCCCYLSFYLLVHFLSLVYILDCFGFTPQASCTRVDLETNRDPLFQYLFGLHKSLNDLSHLPIQTGMQEKNNAPGLVKMDQKALVWICPT